MNMEKEQDFFASLPKETGGVVAIAFGVLMLTGAIRRWKWVLEQPGIRWKSGFLPFMYSWFGVEGVRIGIIITSVIIILCGVVLVVLM